MTTATSIRSSISVERGVLLIAAGIISTSIAVSELAGFYWPIILNQTLYLSFDKRPVQALAFGVLAGSAVSLAVVAVLSRRGLLPRIKIKLFARITAIVVVWAWVFLVSSYAENILYRYWILADALGFLVTLNALLAWRSARSLKSILPALLLALMISLSLAIPGYASANKTTDSSITSTCGVISCPLGVTDPTSPGPPWGRLVQGRVYDFYFDVLQGQVGIMLVSAWGTGNTTYWIIGGSQRLSNWNGVGVYEFEWTAQTTGFYRLVFLNQNFPSGSLIMTRVSS